MKRIYRKLIYAIITFSVIASIFYFIDDLRTKSINRIEIISQDSVNSISLKSDIKNIIASFKNGERKKNISTDNFILFNFKLINAKNEVTIKNLFVDYKNANIYFKNENNNNIYKILEDFEQFYFNHQAFSSIYKNSSPSKLEVLSTQSNIKPAINTKWSYRKLDGIYYSANSNIESDYVYKFNIIEFLNFDFSRNPSKLEYVLFKDSLEIDRGILKENSFKTPDEDGNYILNIVAKFDNEVEGFKGIIESKIPFIMDLPPEFSVNEENIYQGDILKVAVKNLNLDETPYIKQSIFKLFSFNEIIDGKTYGYIPISYRVKKGNHNISFGVNNKKLNDLNINVLPRDFNIQYLTIDKNVAKNTKNDEAYEEFAKYFTPKRYKSNSKPYFDKPFILPVKGRLSTEYGETRYVNNSPTSYNHSGLDIAIPAGTSINASNSGKVTVSMYLTLTGNTIMIDHGNGLFSIYYHMKDRFVEEGDMVEIGEKIGTVGSTGFSTGPHLHFIISYYDQNLEPGYFIYNEPVTYKNYKSLFDLK